jgi:hypothetical protein
MAAGVAAVNAYLFFNPPGGPTKAFGYDAVVSIDRRTQSLIQAIAESRGVGPVTILHHREVISWRQLAYYFPEDFVIYLPLNPSDHSWMMLNHKPVPPSLYAGMLPGSGRLVLVDPDANPAALAAEGWTQHGLAYYRDVPGDAQLTVGAYKLTRLQ